MTVHCGLIQLFKESSPPLDLYRQIAISSKAKCMPLKVPLNEKLAHYVFIPCALHSF